MKLNQDNQLSIIKEINLSLKKNNTIISNEIEKLVENMIISGKREQELLLELIIERNINNNEQPSIIDGFIFSKLMDTNINDIKKNLKHFFPNGIIDLEPSLKINYQPLQDLLIKKNFREADIITQKYLCKLVEINLSEKNKKEWLYFTDIQFLTPNDLFTIDLLWKVYSKGKFGFSVQKKLWIKNNCKWNKLWEKIEWTNKGAMKRYPKDFIWKLEAPVGHLPLFNQLRGTQTLSALFKYITW
uniref:GUN4-like domain-containing protein n=1 Tax=Dasyclonium flaccidum TaxID=2007274 RepID=A0A1Z1ML09_9FLOR|nr:hypothetical protein [Dasyclonium flaccidum]ARW66542.1 hypothetical protein [Dasyclonium flaccidum]